MASLGDLARERTELEPAEVLHLQRLARLWGLLADMSAADLLLFAPTRQDGQYVVLGHVRPTTASTIYPTDPIGRTFDRQSRPLVATALEQGREVEGELRLPSTGEDPAVVLSVPVRFDGQVVAVLSRESPGATGRPLSELERTYRRVFLRFSNMIASGHYPFAHDEAEQFRAPRVGDGMITLDVDRRVEFASPNAVSAFHKLGVHRYAVGRRFEELGLDEQMVRKAYSTREPVTVELDRGADTTVIVRCVPLLEDGEVAGAMIGLRDISELRRRDRLLMSKDATIREIHHRVKNNLQTISSLLRLQSRRLESPEAKEALDQSVRRIASIALVHETLATDSADGDGDGDAVAFVDIVKPIVRLVEEGLSSPERPLFFDVRGEAGELSSETAMPLAVVITELLQNAVDHAYPGRTPDTPGTVAIVLSADSDHVEVEITDDGVGVDDDFTLDGDLGLGLTIVRTFIEGELGGTISMSSGGGPAGRAGTVVRLRVPKPELQAPVRVTDV